MYKIYILIFISISIANACISNRTTPIKPIEDNNYCYERKLASDNTIEFDNNYCCNTIIDSPSSSYISQDTCSGPYATEDGVVKGPVSLHSFAFSLSKVLCSEVNQEKDLDGNDIHYNDGIPYDSTSVENGLYYNNYDDILVCQSEHLQINNDSCTKPDYNNRNLADAIIKRDKIAAENNLTDLSGIQADSIVYNADTGAIESFSFTATNSTTGAIEIINTSFTEDDKVYTVEEDGTVSESDYVPSTGGTSGNGVTSGDINGIQSALNSIVSNTDNLNSTAASILSDTGGNIIATNESNKLLESVKNDLNQINKSFHPENPVEVDNPLEDVETIYDDDIIPKVQELVENFTNDFTDLQETYTEK